MPLAPPASKTAESPTTVTARWDGLVFNDVRGTGMGCSRPAITAAPNATLYRLGWAWAPFVGQRITRPERGERMLFSRLPLVDLSAAGPPLDLRLAWEPLAAIGAGAAVVIGVIALLGALAEIRPKRWR